MKKKLDTFWQIIGTEIIGNFGDRDISTSINGKESVIHTNIIVLETTVINSFSGDSTKKLENLPMVILYCTQKIPTVLFWDPAPIYSGILSLLC